MTESKLAQHFDEGNIVMICEHLYANPQGHLERKWQRWDKPRTITREDQSRFAAHGMIVCLACSQADPRQINLVETELRDRKFLISDFHCKVSGRPKGYLAGKVERTAVSL